MKYSNGFHRPSHKKSDSVFIMQTNFVDPSQLNQAYNFSIMESKGKTSLDWKTYLKDENIQIDSLNFQKWDKKPCKDEEYFY